MRLEPLYTVTFTTPEAWSVEVAAEAGIDCEGPRRISPGSCILFAVVKCDYGGRARPSPALVRNERPRKALGSSRPPSEIGGSPNSCLGLRENEEPASARMGPRPGRREHEQ